MSNDTVKSEVKLKVQQKIGDITPASNQTKTPTNFLQEATKIPLSVPLPPYYLVYYLFVEMLEFNALGPFEKVAWSIPIFFNGAPFLIEHRKFGLGVYSPDAGNKVTIGNQIATNITAAVRAAKPYYENIAKQAMEGSKINLENKSRYLFQKYQFFLSEFTKTSKADSSELTVEDIKSKYDEVDLNQLMYEIFLPQRRPLWLAQAAIEAFYSWTEHIFIHIAILKGKITNGVQLAEVLQYDWMDKFKIALDISENKTHTFYSDLIEIRRRARNYIAHGTFGKDQRFLFFHSPTGAIPVHLEYLEQTKKFSLNDESGIGEEESLKIIRNFIEHLWEDESALAMSYIQNSELPIILAYANNDKYKKAMSSKESMDKLIEELTNAQEQGRNMDF